MKCAMLQILELWNNISFSLYSTGKRKIHCIFLDKKEMVEEYDVKTGDLLGV